MFWTIHDLKCSIVLHVSASFNTISILQFTCETMRLIDKKSKVAQWCTLCLKKWDKFKRLYLLYGLSNFYNILQQCTRGVWNCVCQIWRNLIVPTSRHRDLNMRQKIWGFQAAYRETMKLQNVCTRQWGKAATRDVTRDVSATVTSLLIEMCC